MNGDTYKRRNVSPDRMQCGCRWVRTGNGDRLVQCPIHQRATDASVAKFERERTAK